MLNYAIFEAENFTEIVFELLPGAKNFGRKNLKNLEISVSEILRSKLPELMYQVLLNQNVANGKK